MGSKGWRRRDVRDGGNHRGGTNNDNIKSCVGVNMQLSTRKKNQLHNQALQCNSHLKQ